MARRLESSAERRLLAFRRDLTLDLFTHYGTFWDRVSAMRAAWGIEPSCRVPPTPPQGRCHLPPGVRRRQVRSVPTPEGLQWNVLIDGFWGRAGTGTTTPFAESEAFVRWRLALERLHDETVPPEHHVVGPSFESADFWDGFLSACVLYDPPRGDLLAFADHPVARYGEFLYERETSGEDDADAYVMLGPPIRHLADPHAVRAHERERQEKLLTELAERLKPIGVDFWGHLAAAQATLGTGGQLSSAELTGSPCIVVGPHTTETDVRHAFRLLASQLPDRPRQLKPRQDPLVAVQCAIWYDEFDWTHGDLAERFDWGVQHPPHHHAKPRCETARRHIADGRALLGQRSVAA